MYRSKKLSQSLQGLLVLAALFAAPSLWALPPIATPASETFSGPPFEEDMAPFMGDLSSIFTDPEMGALVYAWDGFTGDDLFAIALDTFSGQVDFTPKPNASGTSTLTFRATDPAFESSTYVVTFVLAPLNDPPFLSGDVADIVLAEDTAAVIEVEAEFDDVDFAWEGDNHFVVNPPINDNAGLVTVAVSGTGVTLTPTPNMSGVANVTVEVEDQGGLRASDTFRITYTAQNDPVTVGAAIANVNVLEDVGNVAVDVAGAFQDVDLGFEGDTHTITVIGNTDPALTPSTNSLNALVGSLNFAVPPNANGSSTITIEAEDLAGTTAQLVFDINVAAQNDPPTLSGDVVDQFTPEDTNISVEVASEFTDIDFGFEGDVHTVIFVSSDNPALVSGVPNGTAVDLTVAPHESGVATITVGVEDQGFAQALDTFVLTVTPQNDPVTLVGALADVNTVEDMAAVSVDVGGLFADEDLGREGDSHTITVVNNTDPGLITPLNSLSALAGNLNFNITPEDSGTATITIEAEDAAGTTVQEVFDIVVAPQNDPPFLSGDVGDENMDEDDSPLFVEVLGEFDDVDFANEGDTHTPIIIGNDNPGLVTVAVSGTGVTLTLTPNDNGVANITVGVEDTALAQALDSFVLTVAAGNDDVVLASPLADLSVPEDTASVSVDINGVFTDVDLAFEGDSHTVVVKNIVPPGLVASTNSLSALTGLLDFGITPGGNGTATIAIEAEDAGGKKVTDTFDIVVTPVNDPPVLIGDVVDQTMDEEDPTLFVEVRSEFDDPDIAVEGDTLDTIIISNNNPGLVTVSLSGTGVNLDLTPEASGTATIVVGVEDDALATAQDTFILTVNAVNDPVVAIMPIADRLVNEDIGTVSVSIAGVFDDIDLLYEGDSHTVTVTGNDNPALVTPLNSPLAALTGNLDFGIAANGNGGALITVQAQDAAGTTDSVQFRIDINAVNDPPFVAAPIADQPHSEDAGDLVVSIAGVFDDPDLANEGDIQSFTVNVDNATLVTGASVSGGNVTLNFAPDQNGLVNVTVTVQDSGGLTASDTFAVNVAPVDDDPFVENPVGVLGFLEDAPDFTLNLDTVFDDPDILTNGDTLTYSLVSVSDMSIFNSVGFPTSPNELVLSFVPNVFGSSVIVVRATDSTGRTVDDTFTVNISEVVPVAQDDSATMDEDSGTITIDVLANDGLGEPPTTIVSIGRNWPDPVTGPTTDVSNSAPTTVTDESGIDVTAPNGSLAVVGGMIEYTPKENFNGVDWFEYVISDSDGDTSMAIVTVTVNGIEDDPRGFGAPEYTVEQGESLNVLAEGGLLAYSVDDDGDSLEVRSFTFPTNMVVPNGFTLYADGSFDYTPDPLFAGPNDNFQIRYYDPVKDLYSQPVDVVINVYPEPGPVAAAPPGEVEFDFDLADVPLEDAIASEANVLVMMDDSGSMDWSLMTPSAGGEFLISNSATKTAGVTSYSRTFRYVHQLATNVYGDNSNAPTEEALAADADFAGNDYGVWRARNAAYSTVYYNPQIRYTPWVGLDRNGQEFTDVVPTAAPLDPFDANVQTIDLTLSTHSFTSRRVPGTQVRRKDVLNSNVNYAHYYDTTALGRPVWNDPNAKVTIDGTFPVTLASGASVNYYPGGPDRADCLPGDSDPLVCTYAQELQNFANWFSYYRSREYSSKAALGRAIAGASNVRMGYAVLNNSNERERIDTLNASYRVGHKKDLMDQVYKIISNGSTPLRRALDRAGRHFECVSGDAFGSTASSNPGDANCPVLGAPEGQCQNNFTLLFSDGTWNANFVAGNHDNDTIPPDLSVSPFDGGMFEDNVVGTLADIAMYYYERDLHGLLNGVPTTQRDQDWAPVSAFEKDGEVMHQHMKTYTVGFGLTGNIQLADLPADYTQPFAWGNPFNQGLAKIDDLLHAAVNGRGQFLQANNPVLLSQAFQEAFEDFSDGSVSVSAVAFNSTALREETVEYRGFFNLKFNSGDLRALSVDDTTGVVDNANPLWRAAVQMDTIAPATRKIVTWDNVLGAGIPFEFADLNADQLGVLDEDQLEWLRGIRDDEEPNGLLRSRETVEGVLGDIVHSAPVFVGAPRAIRRDGAPYPTSDAYSQFAADKANRQRLVYVSANDGMMHGFDAGADSADVGTGNELFAYVPNKIIDSSQRFANDLDQLTSLVYSHRYFVDLTPNVEDVYMKANAAAASDSWNTVLMGGLGGGGKGYFLLNITDPNSSFSSVTNAKATVLWEFTDDDDTYPVDSAGDPLVDGSGNPLLDLGGDPVKDLGYAFSNPALVMSNAEDGSGNKIWVSIFGNGYNSTAGIGKLFILDLEKGLDGWAAGDFIKLSTGEGAKSAPDPLAGLPNGLGSPAVIDEDGNGTGDLVYAGDLFGNLYRFNISSTDPTAWTVTKLFQATYDETLATRQPITTAPFVYKHPTETGYMVIVGTGSYITEQDGVSRDIQSVYGIWDRGEASPATAASDAKSTRLVEQVITNIVDETNANFVRQRGLTANAVNYAPDAGPVDGVYGWYFDFDMPRAADTVQGNANPDTTGDAPPAAQFPGERAIRRFVPRGDSLLITTVIPRDNNTCFRAPPGAILPIDRLTGGNPPRAILDINNDGYVDDNDFVTYNGVNYFSGILFDTDDLDGTLVDPSLLIGSGNEDFLFLSGGDDQITLRIAGPASPKTGRLSWRELDDAN